MLRREFLLQLSKLGGTILVGRLLVACGEDISSSDQENSLDQNRQDTKSQPSNHDDVDPNHPADEKKYHYVEYYDLYAVALYFDGGIGPKTGEITAKILEDKQSLIIDFWHGHGGKQHQYQLNPEHFVSLLNGEKVVIETTVVDGHTHKLFIDPNQLNYRIPNREPTSIKVYDEA